MRLRLLALAALLTASAVRSRADEEAFGRGAFRLGALLPYRAAGDDLKGTQTVTSDAGASLGVPQLRSSWGRGFLLGIGGPGGALELTYARTGHDARFQAFARKATLSTVSLDAKFFAGKGQRVQPFVQVGWIPYARLIAERSARTSSGGIVDGQGSGALYSFNAGAGVEVYLVPWLSLHGTFAYQYLAFAEWRPAGGSWSNLPEDLAASGFAFTAGVCVSIPTK